MQRLSLLVGLCLMVLAAPFSSAAEEGFKPLFNGQNLEGWKSPEMGYWSVEEGAITGKSSAEHPCKENQFLVWENGELDDFELKLQFRIQGLPEANSGVQFRSGIKPNGHVFGYQADMDREGQWLGALHDELGRGTLGKRGTRNEVGAEGKKETVVADATELFKGVNLDGWNEYHITARGNKITLRINGKVTAEVTDNDAANRDLSGLLALQLHSGPPMKVQFKDILLKRLPLSEGRKKVIFVAGGASHGFGAHDHLSGCKLLAHRLNASGLPVYATVYHPGWPKDPTALDNADAVIVYADGGTGNPAAPHVDEVAARTKQGMGFGAIHYGVEVEKGKVGDAFLDWTGGYFEAFRSVNPHWTIKEAWLAKDHPVTRGVRPFSTHDEWYYHMRFSSDKGVEAILQAVPPVETITDRWSPKKPAESHAGNPEVYEDVVNKRLPQVLMWARQRPDGGRGFGFTGGHDHWNWGQPDQRRLILNAAAWIAGLDIPAAGVPDKPVTIEELLSNHDEPVPANFNAEPIKKQLEEWNK